MTKIITIDGSKYALPEGMAIEDVRALAGFLVTLIKIDYAYCYGQEESQFYACNGAQISIGEQELVTKSEAITRATKSREEHEARKASEAAVAKGDLVALHVAS